MASETLQHHAQWTELDDRCRRFVHRWTPVGEATAVVCIVHGLGEHGARYETLARDLCAQSLAVVAFDQQGHGRDGRLPGCIDSYSSLLDDIDRLLRWTEGTLPELPRVLLGHSMGGNLVVNHSLRRQANYRAVVASSPMFRSPRNPGAVGEFFARLLLRFVPNHRLTSIPKPERLMDDPAEVAALEADLLFHGRLSLRLGAGLIDSGRWALKNANRLTCPMLLSHGDNDMLTCPKASAEFAASAGLNCDFSPWPGMLHDPFRCLDKRPVVDRFVEFIRQHSQGQTRSTARPIC